MTVHSGADQGLARAEAPPSTPPRAVSVAICVATYRRPDGLRRLLAGLNQLRFSACPSPALRVVVVDNDPAASAAPVCADAAPRLAWPLHFEHEPRRGIAQARNRGLDAAGSAEFVAFIDDDEVPDPRWLEELLLAQQRFDADVVCGPVLPVFDAEVPSWLRSFHERRRYATGTPLSSGSTSNALVRRACGDRTGVWFDERLGLTGGEDTHFFRRLARLGARMVWADGATVREFVPPSRVTVSWVLRRAYRTGQTLGFCDRVVDGSAARRAARVAKGCYRVAQGLVTLPLGAVLGREALVRSLWRVCRGAGSVSGVVGGRYEEYREVQGR